MLWPESIIRHALEGDYGLKLYFFDLAEKTNATQVVGAFSSKDGFYNSLFLIYPNRTISEEIYHKRRPVPFGEYIPYPELFDALLPTLTEISALSFDIIPGDSTSLFHTKDGLLGGLICFDSIYPALARQSTLDGAELLLLSTNDTWFDGSFAKNMHLSHAQLRAVENGRTVIRCGNTGISAAIDAHGRIYAETPPDEAAYFTVSASLYKSPTLYTRLGDVIVYCAIAFLIISPFAAIKPKNKKA